MAEIARKKSLLVSAGLAFAGLLYVLQAGCKPTEARVGVPVVEVDRFWVAGSSELREMRMIGPFEAKDFAEANDRDFLKESGPWEETDIAPVESRLLPATKKRGVFAGFARGEQFDLNEIFGLRNKRDIQYSAAYAEAILHAAEPTTCYLALGSDDGLKVWLNGRLVCTAAIKRPLERDSDLVRLDLRPGNNFLRLKITDSGSRWEFVAELVREAGPRLATYLRQLVSVSTRLIVDQASSLAIRPPLTEEKSGVEVALVDEDGKTRCRTTAADFSSAVKKGVFTDGIYELLFSVDGEVRKEKILMGDRQRMLEGLRARVGGRTHTDDAAALMAPYLKRLEVLTREGNVSPDDISWQRRFVFAYGRLDEILRREACGGNFADLRGLQLRQFVSAIDGTAQTYRIYLPEGIPPGSKVPLAVILPTVISANIPFIESSFVANQQLAERIAREAEHLGVAVLWPGYRGQTYGNPIEMQHVRETLAAAAKVGPIDESRVFLVGLCSSGITALLLAESTPAKFSAIGLLSPVVARRKNGYGEFLFPRPGEPQAAYSEWLRANDPMVHLDNIAELPVKIIFKPQEPGHGRLDETNELVRVRRALPAATEYEYREKIEPMETQYADVFEWARHQQGHPAPTRFTVETEQAKWGPFYWLKLERQEKAMMRTTLATEVTVDGIVKIKTGNAAEIAVNLDQLPLAPDRREKPQLEWNDRPVVVGPVSRDGFSVLTTAGGGATGARGGKSAAVEGPFSDLYTSGFLFVVGVGGSDEDRAGMAKLAHKLKDDWEKRNFGSGQIVTEREILDGDHANDSLVLIGNDRTNALLKRYFPDGQVSLGSDRIRVGGREFHGEDLCFAGAFADGIGSRRYVAVVGATDMAKPYFGSAFLAVDGWFDYAIWDGAREHLLEARHLDESWSDEGRQ